MATGLMVFVDSGTGAAPVAVTVPIDATVGDVRYAAVEQGADLGSMPLTYGGAQIPEEGVLADLGICSEATLHCTRTVFRWDPDYLDGTFGGADGEPMQLSERDGKLIAESTRDAKKYVLLDGGLSAMPPVWRSPAFHVRDYGNEMYFGLTRGKFLCTDTTFSAKRHIMCLCVQPDTCALYSGGRDRGYIEAMKRNSPWRILYDEGSGFRFELADGAVAAPSPDQHEHLMRELSQEDPETDNTIYLFVGTFCQPPGVWEILP
eukprot:TRINITY_DN4881_c0_g1_i1.p1 TRINITY_DN4881_c0_g1~~TRINITY_DN4881_c0_g1_i1.p1  ORF type:complete len:294 (+),score=47.45 TRINITY_DN4881_c0_g1_i1:99-884(+)